MREIIIQDYTTKAPLTMIGKEAGICYNSDTFDDMKNYNRGIRMLKSGHGRTFEFPDIYMIIGGYSARVIRELYTHIGGSPTRLQSSTRYVDYTNFDYIIPPSIRHNKDNQVIEEYTKAIRQIRESVSYLAACGIPKEDYANLFPLGMTTKIVYKINLRTLIDMSRVRMCSRTYWEYRTLMQHIITELYGYSEEWQKIIDMKIFHPKCVEYGYCSEEKCCGFMPSKKEIERREQLMNNIEDDLK